ncbi:YoaK family protein [Chitinimonas sp.]|uniref:YoaK family protein n=1 Tax=Chitinimonas sp. TaxID=1934313 RepID=UPI002F928B79
MAWDRNTTLGCVLGFTAGYVDTVGFVALFGLFTAHVTGNFVLIGAELAQPGHGVLMKLLAFPAFVLAVAMTRLLTLSLSQRGKPLLRPVLLLQAVFLTGFMVVGLLALPVTDTAAPLALLAGVLGATGMGVQNAGSRLVLSQLAPTTVMTGNVTQLVIDLVDILRGTADAATRARAGKFFWPILAFGLGAIGGAFGYVYGAFWALLLPIALLLLQVINPSVEA